MTCLIVAFSKIYAIMFMMNTWVPPSPRCSSFYYVNAKHDHGYIESLVTNRSIIVTEAGSTQLLIDVMIGKDDKTSRTTRATLKPKRSMLVWLNCPICSNGSISGWRFSVMTRSSGKHSKKRWSFMRKAAFKVNRLDQFYAKHRAIIRLDLLLNLPQEHPQSLHEDNEVPGLAGRDAGWGFILPAPGRDRAAWDRAPQSSIISIDRHRMIQFLYLL